MKQLILIVLIFATLLFGGAAYYYSQKSSVTVRPNIIPTPTIRVQATAIPTNNSVYCLSSQLQAHIALQGAAGNIFGVLTLKNISQKSCEILGGTFITASYAATVKNITVSHVGNVQTHNFILSPSQTLYSQVHYPNGPQCQSVGLNPTPVTFSYKISPTETVVFSPEGNGLSAVVQACKSPTDITAIQVWNLSNTPITQ